MDPIQVDIGKLSLFLWQTAGFKSCSQPNVVYLPVVEGDGRDVWHELSGVVPAEFALCCVSGLDWNNDLSPWKCEGVFSDDAPFRGNACVTLQWLVDEAVPAVESKLSVKDPGRTIAGYSLGGLFALWALQNCTAFENAVSASGSLWFPGFTDYYRQHGFARQPRRVYLSLGKKETRTPSRLLRNVADATKDVHGYLVSCGVESRFEWNPGNHFKDPALRTAKGISWVLQSGD